MLYTSLYIQVLRVEERKKRDDTVQQAGIYAHTHSERSAGLKHHVDKETCEAANYAIVFGALIGS